MQVKSAWEQARAHAAAAVAQARASPAAEPLPVGVSDGGLYDDDPGMGSWAEGPTPDVSPWRGVGWGGAQRGGGSHAVTPFLAQGLMGAQCGSCVR